MDVALALTWQLGSGGSPGLYPWLFKDLLSSPSPPTGNPTTGALPGVPECSAHTPPPADGPDQCQVITTQSWGHFGDNPATHASFSDEATETQDREPVAQSARQVVPSETSERPVSFSRAGPRQVRARAGAGNSPLSLALSAPFPACTKFPGYPLSFGDLSLSMWALIRSCPQEKRA